MMRLGVHTSIGKGLPKALLEAQDLGCDCLQIFAGNPRGWERKELLPKEVAAFRQLLEDSHLKPLVVHAPYLPNPATEKEELYQKTLTLLTKDFQRANDLGASFFVLHSGRTSERDLGIKRVAQVINHLLEQVTGTTILLIENQAGGKNEIASNFQELAQIIAQIADPQRIGLCFDTCHAFAAGYDLRQESGWQRVLAEFEKYLDFSLLKLWHLNDALHDLGSGRDRHQHIGEGFIGTEGFWYLLNNPQLNQLPGILETPQKTPEDDQRNLATLRRLVEE